LIIVWLRADILRVFCGVFYLGGLFMDMEIERYIRAVEARAVRREPTESSDISATGVASELTGVMPSALLRGDEIAEYQDLFPKL